MWFSETVHVALDPLRFHLLVYTQALDSKERKCSS